MESSVHRRFSNQISKAMVGKKIKLTKNQSENPWSLDRGMNDVMS